MRDRSEYFYVCAGCDWQLQFGDVPLLYLGELRGEIVDFLKEHEAETGHKAWWLRSIWWMEVHR